MRDAGLARPHQGCSVASLAWSSGSALYVTVVVKTTLSVRDGGPCALVTPAPVESRDRFLGREHASSLVGAGELFPYRPRVDVTFVGHAHLPPEGRAAVRLAVVGDGGWIDKTLDVRSPPAQGRTRGPALRVPLSWEGTWADEDNVLGVVPGSGAQAWIRDPNRPGAAVGLGPLPPGFARRVRTLGGIDPRFLDDDAPRFPEGFDWEHFHVAPADQQLAWMAGTETLELQGLVAGWPSIHTRLPGLAAAAWAFAPWEVGEGQPLDLVPDTLVIDGDRGLLHVIWRGTYPLLGEDWSLSQLQILASVTAAEVAEEIAVAPASRSAPEAPRTLAGVGPAREQASLFDTDDGVDDGTKPLTRKELLEAMAAAGKALPFGGVGRASASKTEEIDLPPPSAAPASATPQRTAPAAARAEETRRLPLDSLFTAGTDELTVTGETEALAAASHGTLPPWLRGAPRRDTEVDAEERSPASQAAVDQAAAEQAAAEQAAAEQVDDELFDEETHASGDEPSRR